VFEPSQQYKVVDSFEDDQYTAPPAPQTSNDKPEATMKKEYNMEPTPMAVKEKEKYNSMQQEGKKEVESEVKQASTKKPYIPEYKYEAKNFRPPLKTPKYSPEDHPVIRVGGPEARAEYRTLEHQPQQHAGHLDHHPQHQHAGQLDIVEVHRPKQPVYDNDQEIITLPSVRRFSGNKQSYNINVKASFNPVSGDQGQNIGISKRRGELPAHRSRGRGLTGPGVNQPKVASRPANVKRRRMLIRKKN